MNMPIFYPEIVYSFILLAGLTYSVHPARIKTKLIHRDSFFRSNDLKSNFTETLWETIGRELGNNNVESKILPNRGLFYVNFSIGDPPVPQLALMDTGSSLLWVQCEPCSKCSIQTRPMFDPSKSLTFDAFPCKDYYCEASLMGHCGPNDKCFYRINYVKGASSRGVLATEQLSFTDSLGVVTLSDPTIVFGCGHDNEKLSSEKITGIFGLGNSPTSLAVQFGNKFSYCVGDIFNHDYSHNQLVLGDDLVFEGASTPFEKEYGHYHLSLKGISVGGKVLDIDPYVFKRRRYPTGVLLDSGTAFTWLADDAYIVFENEIKNIMNRRFKRYFLENYLCYFGKLKEDLNDLVGVIFQFAGGSELALDAESVFFEVDGYFCLAVRPSTIHGQNRKDATTIGLMAQLNYNVGYDLDGSRLFFQKMNCKDL